MPLTDLKPSKPLTDSTKVRAMLPEIEAALARGITREQVLEKLKADGVVKSSFGIRGLDAAILRERKLRAKHPERATRVDQPGAGKVDQPVQTTPPARTATIPKALAQLTPVAETRESDSNEGPTDSKSAAAKYKAGAKPSDNPEY